MREDHALSLRQGLDRMPDGVCISKDGRPVLINAKMKELMRAAFISGDDDASVFAMPGGIKLKDGCSIENSRESTLLLLPDGSAWNIKTGTVRYDGEIYNECTAYDVTELYGKSLELKKRNDRIAATNEKIRTYSKEMDSIIRDRELLDAKIKIHDDVGRALLSLRSYLYRQNGDRDSLIRLWRVTISVLRRETIPDSSDDRMEALSEAAEAVDVVLHYGSDIPDDPVIREISAAAIRECLTNTVKHAEGHNIYIKTSYDAQKYTIKIKNDGKAPDSQIEETGGLHTLRRSVQRFGGEMNVEWQNGFELTITLYRARKG